MHTNDNTESYQPPETSVYSQVQVSTFVLFFGTALFCCFSIQILGNSVYLMAGLN